MISAWTLENCCCTEFFYGVIFAVVEYDLVFNWISEVPSEHSANNSHLLKNDLICHIRNMESDV